MAQKLAAGQTPAAILVSLQAQIVCVEIAFGGTDARLALAQ